MSVEPNATVEFPLTPIGRRHHGAPAQARPPQKHVRITARRRLGFGGGSPAIGGGTPKPTGYLDEVTTPRGDVPARDAIEKVIVDRGELTLHVVPERIAEVAKAMRDDESLRFELCSSVSGVDYLGSDERRLHVTYHLTSMTYRRRVRLEAAVTAENPHLPTVTQVYPTADWQERETYDMFGVIFDGHNPERIIMTDDGRAPAAQGTRSGVTVGTRRRVPPHDKRRTTSEHEPELRARARDDRGQDLHGTAATGTR